MVLGDREDLVEGMASQNQDLLGRTREKFPRKEHVS
jgi:hypothetical protein